MVPGVVKGTGSGQKIEGLNHPSLFVVFMVILN
jgi:hypothetical protein